MLFSLQVDLSYVCCSCRRWTGATEVVLVADRLGFRTLFGLVATMCSQPDRTGGIPTSINLYSNCHIYIRTSINYLSCNTLLQAGAKLNSIGNSVVPLVIHMLE